MLGEVPKRLKGLPWKGSRSLVAAQGFKSLLLRCEYNRKKKFLTFSRENARIYRLLKNSKNEIKKFLTKTSENDKIKKLCQKRTT